MTIMQTLSLTDKTSMTWPYRILMFFILFQLSTIISLAFSSPQQVDTFIKPKISQLLNIENLGHLQSIKTNMIGPVTFYRLKFFSQGNIQVTAKFTQYFGFNPMMTCVSGSNKHLCQ